VCLAPGDKNHIVRPPEKLRVTQCNGNESEEETDADETFD